MKILILLGVSLLIILMGCNTVSEEVLGLGSTDPPDSTGFYSTSAAGVTLEYRVDTDMLHCILSAETSGWVAVGFNPSNVMQDANFIIGYVNSNTTEIRDDWGISPTAHVSDESLGGASDVEIVSGSEISGITEIEFKIPLNSGDQYDQLLESGQTYPIVLAKGSSDNYDSFHTDAGFSSIIVEEGGINEGPIIPDTTEYQSIQAGDMSFYWMVDQDSLRCVVSAPTSGWVGVGFDAENIMLNANFIMGYVQDEATFISDEWGTGTSSHASDISLGGTNDIGVFGGIEDLVNTIIYFAIPLNSMDSFDKELVIDNSYSLILAYGSSDDFLGFHSAAYITNFTVNNETGGGDLSYTTGGSISEDTDISGFDLYEEDDYSFRWKIVNDSLRCMVRANTTGWIAVGFDPEEEMLNANLIIGYVDSGIAYVRDDWGISETSHTSDVGLGGINNVTRVFGDQTADQTEIRFTIPLSSSDLYDKVLTPGVEYEIIIAFGFDGEDNFSSMHQDEDSFDIEL